MENPPYSLRGLALLAPVVALTLVASEAEAVPVSCTGWGTTMTWQGPAYGLTSARLYRVGATSNVLVETSDVEVLWSVAGTQFIGANWQSVPLDGTYFAVIEAVFYGGLGVYPTPEQLLAWPANRTYRLGETTPRFTCVAPPPPPPVCGDGVVNQASEACDDGNVVDGDGCSASCAIEPPPSYCGDGLVDQGEQCDDGNAVDGDGCSSACSIEVPPAFCGDGWVNQPTEECDDGNVIAGDGCSATCTVEPLSGCTRTIGYWGTHFATARNRSQRIAWPISESTALCGSTWLTQINAVPRGGDAFIILARQWIGARLNAAAGAGTGSELSEAITRAGQLLSDCSISSAERAEALDVASVLDAYNNGLVGPGHCR